MDLDIHYLAQNLNTAIPIHRHPLGKELSDLFPLDLMDQMPRLQNRHQCFHLFYLEGYLIWNQIF